MIDGMPMSMTDVNDEELFANHPELMTGDEEVPKPTSPDTNQEAPNPSGDWSGAIDQAKSLIDRQSEEIELLRGMLDDLLAQNHSLARNSDDESFMRDVRAMYQQDPMGATDAMLKRFQDNVFQEMERRMSADAGHNRRMDDALGALANDPAYSGLNPFREELEYLVRGRGLHPQEAADLINQVRRKNESAAKKVSSMAKEVRNRAMVESDGEVGEPPDMDREFNNVIKKSKNLNQMFAGFRKIGLLKSS
jgi:hypothetical protein